MNIAIHSRAAASFGANLVEQVVAGLREPALAAVFPVRRTHVLPAGSQWLRPAADSGPQGKSRVLALVHVHYPDLVPEIGAALARIPEQFDVIATSTVPLDPDTFGLPNVWIRVYRVGNRGRDILPMLHVATAGLTEGYDAVCKVHTKRSVWRADSDRFRGSGREWGEALLSGVLGSPQSVRQILPAIRSPRGPALVTAPGQILGSSYWGANLPATWLLARRLGMSLRASGLAFAAGSMYWIAPSILDQLTKLGLGPENFEPELGQDDGTTAHAIERLIGVLAQQGGGIVAADDVLH